MRDALELKDGEDYNVMLGIAEKLAPGIYVKIAGDPESMEERFMELFENF